MTIPDFIEKAIEGGWKPSLPDRSLFNNLGQRVSNQPSYTLTIEQILLDPLAWQAVGKVEGWKDEKRGFAVKHANHDCPSALGCEIAEVSFVRPEWEKNMHRMIDALAEGKTIEEFLETL